MPNLFLMQLTISSVKGTVFISHEPGKAFYFLEGSELDIGQSLHNFPMSIIRHSLLTVNGDISKDGFFCGRQAKKTPHIIITNSSLKWYDMKYSSLENYISSLHISILNERRYIAWGIWNQTAAIDLY